jgi:hypothetical protein
MIDKWIKESVVRSKQREQNQLFTKSELFIHSASFYCMRMVNLSKIFTLVACCYVRALVIRPTAN